jgi:FAD/FMN-containing dehydrogenase
MHTTEKGRYSMLEQEHTDQPSRRTTSAVLGQPSIDTLQASLRGELFQPGKEGYDVARSIYNAMIDRHPALIVRCAGVADVIQAVNFARTHHLLVSVRGGGHNVAGFAVCDDGLVIDLSGMKGMHIDPAAQTVRAEAGLTWGELNHDLQVFGLAGTGGFVSTTGVAGFTLGGGFGWLVRKHGLACDNLLAVDLVTADGQFLIASSTENPDLFWGARGGGGNFGIVTSFKFRVHPVGMALAGLLLYPFTKAKAVLQFWRDYAGTAPEELASAAALFTAPPWPFLPEQLHGTPLVAIAVVYAGPLEVGEQVLRPLRAFGPPLADLVQPMPYSAIQTMVDAFYPRGLQHYWKSNFLPGVSDAAIDTILAHFTGVPSPQTVMHIEHLGDALSRVDANETAFAHRGWPYNLLITSMWTEPADAEKNIHWTRQFWEALQPFAAEAVYVNFLSSEGEDRVKAAYGAHYEQLVALKNKYDPTNFFRLNQNIKPTV